MSKYFSSKLLSHRGLNMQNTRIGVFVDKNLQINIYTCIYFYLYACIKNTYKYFNTKNICFVVFYFLFILNFLCNHCLSFVRDCTFFTKNIIIIDPNVTFKKCISIMWQFYESLKTCIKHCFLNPIRQFFKSNCQTFIFVCFFKMYNAPTKL